MKRNTRTALILMLPILAMVGLTAASVPLYRIFCRVTGYGGTTQVAAAAPGAQSERRVTVRFNADTSPALAWDFRPAERSVTLRLGEERLISYKATNRSDRTLTGVASYNVTPEKAAVYFNKIQCFCFTEQTLEAGRTVDMPVVFFVDPALASDPNTREIATLTLSYTFFPAPDDKAKSGGSAHTSDAARPGTQTLALADHGGVKKE